MSVWRKNKCFPTSIWLIRATLMLKFSRKAGKYIKSILLDLLSLILAGHQKKLDVWIIANFSSIGRKNKFSVLLDTSAEIGAISPIGMESPLFASDFLFLSADLVLFIPNVHQLQRKC